MNPELLNAVNVVVKAGRQELTRLANIDQTRAKLESGEFYLYDMSRHRHGALFIDDDVAVECGFINARFIIAKRAEDVLEAIARANRMVHEREPKESRHQNGVWGDLRTVEGVLRHLKEAEAHESMGGFARNFISDEDFKKGLREIEADLIDLKPFRLTYGTEEWELAFDGIFSPASSSISNVNMAWNVMLALKPSLTKAPHAQRVFRALLT